MRARYPIAFFVTIFAASCGSRTGLLAPEIFDAAPDVKPDVHDSSVDVQEEDAAEEDVVFPDVPIISDCPDAGETLVYVLGAKNELYSFYPPTLTFKSIGTIACPGPSSPNSMAVTRSGIAFTNFLDGHLFEVSTANAACKATSYVAKQDGITTYGMGYAGLPDGGEELFVSENGSQPALAYIDTKAFTLNMIAPLAPKPPNCELTGTGAGQLFGFCPFGTGSYVIEIDPVTAQILSSHQLAAGSSASSFAFAFWGGQFWIFTGNNGSTVTLFDPQTLKESTATTAPIEIVGAGVSTCAPLSL